METRPFEREMYSGQAKRVCLVEWVERIDKLVDHVFRPIGDNDAVIGMQSIVLVLHDCFPTRVVFNGKFEAFS